MSWLGIDVGGANLKAADGRGWRGLFHLHFGGPQDLAEALTELVQNSLRSDRLAVTMTGELCDCFKSKAEGVRHILDCVQKAARNRDVYVYCVDGRFVTPAEARNAPLLAAASNWHALGTFVCRFVSSRCGLLIDVGSTTTDVIPLVDGQVAAIGHTDTDRLLSQELLYRGVGRTPLCALTDELPLRGRLCRIAAEVFATTADAYLLLGLVDEDSSADWTADGRPLTMQFARQRLARQLCADTDEISPADFDGISEAVDEALKDDLTRAVEAVLDRLPERPGVCMASGTGEFLSVGVVGRLLPGCQVLSLAREIGSEASRCAPAHAVAVLAENASKNG